MLTAESIIQAYQLEPLDQEGGFFRQVFCSPHKVSNQVLGAAYTEGGFHPMGTLIHFLLTGDNFSALHRLPTVEHWMYHLGDPVEMLFLQADGTGVTKVLGPDIGAGQLIHVATPEHSWQGTRLLPGAERHGYFFGSCMMVPGFEWTDFEMGDRDALLAVYPDFADHIRARTRETIYKGAL